jgi:hypothetical protein
MASRRDRKEGLAVEAAFRHGCRVRQNDTCWSSVTFYICLATRPGTLNIRDAQRPLTPSQRRHHRLEALVPILSVDSLV